MKMDILQKLKRYRKKIWLFFLLTVFLCGACRAAYVTGARSGHVTIRELDSLTMRLSGVVPIYWMENTL